MFFFGCVNTDYRFPPDLSRCDILECSRDTLKAHVLLFKHDRLDLPSINERVQAVPDLLLFLGVSTVAFPKSLRVRQHRHTELQRFPDTVDLGW